MGGGEASGLHAATVLLFWDALVFDEDEEDEELLLELELSEDVEPECELSLELELLRSLLPVLSTTSDCLSSFFGFGGALIIGGAAEEEVTWSELAPSPVGTL